MKHPHFIIHAIHFIALLSAVAVTLIVSSCKDTVTNVSSVEGLYEFTGFDSSGSVISRGSFTLSIKDTTHLVGSWMLQPAKDSQSARPLIGRGELQGSVEHDTSVVVNLNPNYVDNNVYLLGSVKDIHITGRWNWVGFAGRMAEGTFTAKKLLPD